MENTIQEIDDIVESTGLKMSQLRIRALPLHSGVEDFVRQHKHVIVLEINRDAQLWGILRKELPDDLVSRVSSVAYSDGMPPSGSKFANLILSHLEEVQQ